jgi:hypothetical protein
MDGGSCDFNISTSVTANFEYPASGKGACSSEDSESFTSICETNGDGGSPTCNYGSSVWTSADCSATCASGTFDFAYACQTYTGSASYTNKTVAWNAPSKRYVDDVTVRDGFILSWDIDRTFGGACTATSTKIKKATIQVTTTRIILRIYIKLSDVSNQIWKYEIDACQEMDEFSTAVNAQSHDTETWSIGISATDGSSDIGTGASLIPVAETEVSDGTTVSLKFTYPQKVGLETDMRYEVDPSISSCGTTAEYSWTAQSALVQRTTSASWDVYRCPRADFAGTWTTSNVGSEITSLAVSIS